MYTYNKGSMSPMIFFLYAQTPFSILLQLNPITIPNYSFNKIMLNRIYLYFFSYLKNRILHRMAISI